LRRDALERDRFFKRRLPYDQRPRKQKFINYKSAIAFGLLLGTILVVNQYNYPDLAMRAKTFFTLCFILFLIFVFIGDKVLPKPLSTASLQTRTTMNNFLLGLFPTKSKTKDLTQEREKKLEQQLEQSGSKKK
jgi:hypothetical protein